MVFIWIVFFFNFADYARSILRKQKWQESSVNVNIVLMHFQRSKTDKVEKDLHKEGEGLSEVSVTLEMEKNSEKGSKPTKHFSDSSKRSELAWLPKALERALQLYRWARGLFMLVGILISLLGNHYFLYLILTCF